MRLLPGLIPVTQPDVPFYICLSPAEKLTMTQPVSWTRWVSFTELIRRISQEEEDGEIIVQHLAAVYSELAEHERGLLTVSKFSAWLTKITPDGPEITDQVFNVMDRDRQGSLKSVEFILGVLCVFMKSKCRSRCPAFVLARRQLIFMYLDIQNQGWLSESDFLRVPEMEAELSKRGVRVASVRHGLKSCIDGAAVCISAAADNEFRVHESPNGVTLARAATDYVRNHGSFIHYDAFCEAFELGILPEPVHILHWDLNLKGVLGITPQPQTLSTQSLQEIRDALVTIVDDGIKVASVWLKNTASRVHTKVALDGLGAPLPLEGITRGQTMEHPEVSTENVHGQLPLIVQSSLSKELTESVHEDSVQETSFHEERLVQETLSSPKKEDAKPSSTSEAPPMFLAVTTATEEPSGISAQEVDCFDCERVESTLSASFASEDCECAEALLASRPPTRDPTIPTEVSADDSIPEEGEVQTFSLSTVPEPRIAQTKKNEFIKKYLFPLLKYSTKSEILRALPSKTETLEDSVELLNAVVETFAAENFLLDIPTEASKCVVLGATEGDIVKTCTVLQTAILSFQHSVLTSSSVLIPEGNCIIHAGNFLCHRENGAQKQIEIIYSFMALLSLKLAYPRRFFMLRGHYEGAENNAFQTACISSFGSIHGLTLWNKILDLTEYASYGIRVGKYGWVLGGTLTMDVVKNITSFDMIAKPLHFTTTGGTTKIWRLPQSSRHRSIHDVDIGKIEGIMIESLLELESESTKEAALALRARTGTTWVVHRQMIGTTFSLKWQPYVVLEANLIDDEWELQLWRDGTWIPVAIKDPLFGSKDEVKASILSDTIAQCEVHLKAGHVLTKMSSV
eukprot:Gregarina_sp_Pseudo_9__1034@NODE_166_length_3879_cov_29_060417_g153_i0_p1_GENE_NODE_166_length_3879_cov_29_060417_g153_i0NODE_166_length_3879_cov_29_060417_g153_i0_p1_ORF_typecomplete_len855_score50_88EFhand_7/PF13499_6/1_3EFhand_7/PF13499_6/54EFhand_8/PF13833_6/0_27EFhand_8/PF13833_6/1_3e03EFhand_4/PF12763_7/0_62EFhand_4/PF12763_7/4e02_NODE_166_length_3879_cov_29_060417_g153_i01272691